jgi:predicted transcriptional regulator
MAQPTKVKDCMRRSPLTIHPDAHLVQAIETIVDNKLTGLTVTNGQGSAVGTLSELD